VFTSNEPSRPAPNYSFFRLALSGEAGLLLLAWGLARWLDIAPRLERVGAGLLWGTAGAIPLGLALRWMLTTRHRSVRRLVTLVEDQLGPFLVRLSLIQLAVLAAIAGLSEEVLFRGVLLPALARDLSPLGGLLVTSGLFGLVHFASSTYALLAGVMGCYLGVLFLLTGSLVAPIVSHGLYDFAALAVLARQAQRRQR
jgi:membrane protease YdiL (CAAX protease family)